MDFECAMYAFEYLHLLHVAVKLTSLTKKKTDNDDDDDNGGGYKTNCLPQAIQLDLARSSSLNSNRKT